MWLLLHYWTALLTKEWGALVLQRSREPWCTSQKPPYLLVAEFFTSIPPGKVAQQTNSSQFQEYICDRFTVKLVFKRSFIFLNDSLQTHTAKMLLTGHPNLLEFTRAVSSSLLPACFLMNTSTGSQVIFFRAVNNSG